MEYADPAIASSTNSTYIYDQVVEGLVGLKPGTISDVIPVLATDLPQASADGLTYTFKLRSGIKFHDGTPLDAAAVKYNYDRQTNFPPALQNLDEMYSLVFGGFGSGSNLASVEVVDPLTVAFHLRHPQSNFLITQTLIAFAIQSPTALKAGDADNADPSKSAYATGNGTGLVGTGPFMFKEWVANDHVTLAKNPSYWDPAGSALLDTIVFKPFPDQTAELNALQAGDIDFAQLIGPTSVKVVQSDSNLKLIDRGESCNLLQLGFNQSYAPLNNKDIRLAIAYALNKPGYINTFFGGLAVPATNNMPPGIQYYKPEPIPSYDPNKAKQLIAASGLSGTALKIDLWYPSNVTRPYMPDPRGIFQAVSNDLQAVGFTIVPHTAGWTTGYIDSYLAGKYPMWLIGWTCEYGSGDDFLLGFFAYINGKPNPEWAYRNDAMNKAMEDAVLATDPAKAAALWQQAEDMIAADMPDVPILNSRTPAAAHTYVEGLVPAGNLEEHFNTVWLNK